VRAQRLRPATGCDNIYVSSQNHGFDAHVICRRWPPAAVREIHLAGYTRQPLPRGEMLIDSHNALVSGAGVELYAHAIRQLGRARR